MISSPLHNKISLSKLEAVVCVNHMACYLPSLLLGHYLRDLLVKKWYKAHILLG